MFTYRRCSTFIIAAAITVSVLACADALGPNQSPDVLAAAGGTPAADSVWSSESDTTLSANRLRGMIVDPSPDSTTPWHPIANVRIEAAKGDPQSGAMTILATTTSNASGRFVFDKLDVPTGLVFIRATPEPGTSYRTSRWLAAYAFTGPWATTKLDELTFVVGPFLPLEQANAPRSEFAPSLIMGHVLRGSPSDSMRTLTAVMGAEMVFERVAPPTANDSVQWKVISLGTAASARTDANGFYMALLPGAGMYA
ncbi:MAG: hypothetical protein ABJE10_10320, partial [bacterium]